VTVTASTGPGSVTALTATPLTGTTAKLSWTAPTTTSPVVTGYSVIVSKTTTATATDSGITVTQTGTTPSASVAGLTAGTKYYVTVAAKSADGNGPASVVNFTTPNATKLTLSATPAKPVGGEAITLAGQLRKDGTTTAPLAGKTVGVFAKFAGASKYVLVGKGMTTAADGTYSEQYTPTKGGVYLAVFFGDAGSGGAPGDSVAVSNAVTEVPQPVLTLTGTGKAHGKHFTMHVKGKATPTEAGKKVVVYRTVHGTQTKFGKAQLSSKGKYSFVKKHLSAGVYKLRATLKSHFGNAPAFSTKFTIRAN
jgi:hypothetical protein